jgi:hypothetical protein
MATNLGGIVLVWWSAEVLGLLSSHCRVGSDDLSGWNKALQIVLTHADGDARVRGEGLWN